MGELLYRLVRRLGSPFRYQVENLEHLQAGPCVYVANHLGSVGPIQAILSLPVRLHPWVIAEMADHRRAPAYLLDDFIGPAWHLRGFAGRVVSWLVANFAVWLIASIGSVTVDKQNGLFDACYRASLQLLLKGAAILIFPEDPLGPLAPDTNMRPFQAGFAWLCYRYARVTGEPLPVIPAVALPGRRTIRLCAPVTLSIDGERRDSVRRFVTQVEQTIGSVRTQNSPSG